MRGNPHVRFLGESGARKGPRLTRRLNRSAVGRVRTASRSLPPLTHLDALR
jgi:hypothetical protein